MDQPREEIGRVHVLLERRGMAPLIADGSMRVELAKRGYAERPCDRYNLTIPMIVEQIHHEFIDAGATLIQSNTLNANRYALESSMLSARVQEINRKGVWLARAAANKTIPVAGVAGPTTRLLKPLGPISTDDLRSCFHDQISALLSARCDLIILKSFIDLDELEIAIDVVRMLSKDVPVIALKSFPEDGSVLAGNFPSDVARRLTRHGIQAMGSNGTVGPQRMLGIIESLRISDLPLVALPDVGIPTIVVGNAIYNAEPAYVAEAAIRLVEHGACIVGADGGATVEHIKAIAEATQNVLVASVQPGAPASARRQSPQSKPPNKTRFHEALDSRFVSTVELDIPRGLDMHGVLEGARYLKEAGVDAVNISDGARARLRMSPIAISKLVQDEIGMDCITHLACRDRNMVALQSEVLGAHALGVRNILAITGDPTHIGDFPVATSIYDVDAIGLVRALGRMNSGMDLMGNPFGEQTGFCIACAANPAADDLDREIERLAAKAEQGAHVAFSQPVFDEEVLDRFLDRAKSIDIKFLVGIIPLRSVRHAEFLHFEVPGMVIPLWVREKFKHAGPATEAATELGIELATSLLKTVFQRVNGVYLMPPFRKYDVAVKILNQVNLLEATHAKRR
ncbi:MAG: bifunctional homocysteine S-methyltransferase/methylenetetrahydrofolate reductase [Ignavibacteria bacterium]|nr:bifunctional homocysteine S-methyltransferase/methylenetetrahydrofolate reductase [Ignavibacteria bacterium]